MESSHRGCGEQVETHRSISERQVSQLQKRLTLTMIACGVVLAGCAIDRPDEDSGNLARRLANGKTRAIAVNAAVERGTTVLPTLLALAATPPPHIDRCELNIGLAEVFGRLRSKEAIPFLIKNIGLRRTCAIDMNPWHQTPDVIEATFPCIVALLNMGPDGSRALMRAWEGPMSAPDRVAALFVVGRTSGVPEARQFLTAVARQADLVRFWAEEGLKVLEEPR